MIELKFARDFDEKHKRGTAVKIDKIKADKSFGLGIKVRVVGSFPKPRYISLGWFFRDEDLR